MAKNEQRYTSTVKWFNNTRGYGFLQPVPKVTDGDVIIHQKSIERAYEGEFVVLREGDIVSFELEWTDEGARAVNARREK